LSPLNLIVLISNLIIKHSIEGHNNHPNFHHSKSLSNTLATSNGEWHVDSGMLLQSLGSGSAFLYPSLRIKLQRILKEVVINQIGKMASSKEGSFLDLDISEIVVFNSYSLSTNDIREGKPVSFLLDHGENIHFLEIFKVEIAHFGEHLIHLRNHRLSPLRLISQVIEHKCHEMSRCEDSICEEGDELSKKFLFRKLLFRVLQVVQELEVKHIVVALLVDKAILIILFLSLFHLSLDDA